MILQFFQLTVNFKAHLFKYIMKNDTSSFFNPGNIQSDIFGIE